MRDYQGEIVAGESIALQQASGQLSHATHSILKHLRAVLMHDVHVLVDCFVGGGVKRTAAWHVQIFAAGTVDVVRKIQNALAVFRWFEKNGSGAIAEQDTRRAI